MPMTRMKHSEETKRKMSKSHKGHTVSIETKRKISEAHKGKIIPLEARQNMSKAKKGKRTGKDSHMWGKKASLELQKKLSDLRIGKYLRENNPNWKGGKSKYFFDFKTLELKESIRKRDMYRCQECFIHQNKLDAQKGNKTKLNVHHIDYNTKNSMPNNLISLCDSCHTKTNYKREDWTKHFRGMLSSG